MGLPTRHFPWPRNGEARARREAPLMFGGEPGNYWVRIDGRYHSHFATKSDRAAWIQHNYER